MAHGLGAEDSPHRFDHDATPGSSKESTDGTRAGDVVFRSYIIASGATPAAAMDSVLKILFPSVTVEP